MIFLPHGTVLSNDRIPFNIYDAGQFGELLSNQDGPQENWSVELHFGAAAPLPELLFHPYVVSSYFEYVEITPISLSRKSAVPRPARPYEENWPAWNQNTDKIGYGAYHILA